MCVCVCVCVCVYYLIKTRKRDTTLQIRPLFSSLEGGLYKISCLLTNIENFASRLFRTC